MVAKKLSDTTVERWESFYDSIVQSRSPENLKVAYLSGPNPENDLRVFCQACVLPENIWAFESENSTYSDAVVSALNSEFPFIKIINGGLDTFIEASPQRFDVIYLDFCGPLPSRNKKQKTLTALKRILARHALNSPGVLITNFSLPTIEQDEVGGSLLSKLVSCYLYPKELLEDKDSQKGFFEGPVAHGLDPDEWFKEVSNDLNYYYGEFVTRLLIDHASLISTYNRFPKQHFLYKKFFNADENSLLGTLKKSYFHFDEEDGGGDVIVDSGQYPILWTLAALDKELNGRDPNYPQFVNDDEEFTKFAEQFLSQLDVNGSKKRTDQFFFDNLLPAL
ncbi:MAG: class I SAM-dependent methyltransferase [Pseudomonadota bacterium]|nr:class I SAM-dependent methyltransferase [Pseudomonadota bacterium]